MANGFWTHDLRKFLYGTLVMRHGPHHTWLGDEEPAQGTAAYNQTLQQLAQYVSVLVGHQVTWRAVRLQVRWAWTPQGAVRNTGNMRSFIANKTAAIEAGFIRQRDLPGHASVH